MRPHMSGLFMPTSAAASEQLVHDPRQIVGEKIKQLSYPHSQLTVVRLEGHKKKHVWP